MSAQARTVPGDGCIDARSEGAVHTLRSPARP